MIRNTILICATLCCVVLTATAEVVKSKGKGQIVYQGVFNPSADEKQAGIVAAEKNALDNFTATFDSARLELYKKIEPEVLANLDQYVTDYTKLDEEVDKSSKSYTVIIEASINTTLIEGTIQKSSGPSVQSATTANASDSSYMTFVFVARELVSRKAFDAKRTTVEINNSSDDGKEANNVSEDGQSAEKSLEKNAVSEQTTGGSTETKADVLTYRVMTVTAVDDAVNSVMTKAGYETVDPVDAGLDTDSFKNDFGSGDDISPATRRTALSTLKEKQIRYFALANMDVGISTKDEVSGLRQVYVTVTAKVTDLSSKFPKTIASIAGKPYGGLGADDQVAERNALNEAATRSASELLDQLRMKGVQ